MSRVRLPNWGVPVVFAALALLCATPAVAQDDDAFREGLDAQKDRKWQETVTHMRRAIQLSPQDSTRKVRWGPFKTKSTEYLPHYYLGEALFNTNDCAAAVDSWAVSEQQGAVRSHPEFVAAIQKGYKACETKGVLPPAKFDPLLARTTQQVTDVTNLAASISTLGQQNADIWNRNRDTREQYDRASVELQSAQTHLAAGKKLRVEREFQEASAAADRARTTLTTLNATLNSAVLAFKNLQTQAADVEQVLQSAADLDKSIDTKKAVLTAPLAVLRQSAGESMNRARPLLAARPLTAAGVGEARNLAQDASTKLKQIVDELEKSIRSAFATRLADAIAKANQQVMFVEQSFTTLDGRIAKASSVLPEVPTQREALQKRFEAVRRRLDAAISTGSLAGIDEGARLATNVQTEVETITKSFGPLTLVERVHEALVEGSRLFLAGEYQKVIAALEPSRISGVPLQLHVHLFRAASFYALYVRSGERDTAQRDQALAEVDKCKQLNSTFQPDAHAFAPRFIAFYQNATKSQPAVAGTSQQ